MGGFSATEEITIISVPEKPSELSPEDYENWLTIDEDLEVAYELLMKTIFAMNRFELIMTTQLSLSHMMKMKWKVKAHPHQIKPLSTTC